MSNTYKTNDERKSRQLSKKAVAIFNGHEEGDYNTVASEIKSLEVDGSRYGNKRKYMADTKVLERRVERKKANSSVLDLTTPKDLSGLTDKAPVLKSVKKKIR